MSDRASSKGKPGHTPGPWVWSENTSEDGHMIRMGTALTKSPTYSPIHVIDYNHDADPDDDEFLEAEANIRLAAAAPELLEALRGLLLCSLPGDISGQRYIDDARAAIAKAMGGEA